MVPAEVFDAAFKRHACAPECCKGTTAFVDETSPTVCVRPSGVAHNAARSRLGCVRSSGMVCVTHVVKHVAIAFAGMHCKRNHCSPTRMRPTPQPRSSLPCHHRRHTRPHSAAAGLADHGVVGVHQHMTAAHPRTRCAKGGRTGF